MRQHCTLKIGPRIFRIGSDWAAPVRQLRALYADYPMPDDLIAHFTVRLEAARWWRHFLRPSVHI
ncbi:MAG: HprK-related kinase A, partial [Alphaproteobacteria bacterium]|nr:HprK-related kinase A [Alphaproteobacteria bacterium]